MAPRSRAESVAQKLGLQISEIPLEGLQLSWSADAHLQLCCFDKSVDIVSKPFSIDFLDSISLKRHRDASTELVCKAFGKKPERSAQIWDLTAGLGRDGLLLVSAGWQVTLFERNRVLACLLEDAISRYLSFDPSSSSSLSSLQNRVELIHQDAMSFYSENVDKGKMTMPYGVYIDPMYEPNFVGKKAKVKKETQVLHQIVGTEEGLDEQNNRNLFEFARKIALSRIVVKRPLSSPPLLGTVPHSALEGSTQRFDVYFNNRPIIYK